MKIISEIFNNSIHLSIENEDFETYKISQVGARFYVTSSRGIDSCEFNGHATFDAAYRYAKKSLTNVWNERKYN